MAVIEEVTEATRLMEAFVRNTETLLVTIEEGREYLRKHYKRASGDVADMLEQMRSTVAGALSVARIIAEFAPDGSGHQASTTASDISEQLDDAEATITTAEREIRLLKGSSKRIGDIGDKLGRRFVGRSFWGLFGPRADARVGELSITMNEIYFNDFAMGDQVAKLLAASRKALGAAKAELSGPHGPAGAQAMMSEQAEAIAPIVDQLRGLRDRIGDQVSAFDSRSAQHVAS